MTARHCAWPSASVLSLLSYWCCEAGALPEVRLGSAATFLAAACQLRALDAGGLGGWLCRCDRDVDVNDL